MRSCAALAWTSPKPNSGSRPVAPRSIAPLVQRVTQLRCVQVGLLLHTSAATARDVRRRHRRAAVRQVIDRRRDDRDRGRLGKLPEHRRAVALQRADRRDRRHRGAQGSGTGPRWCCCRRSRRCRRCSGSSAPCRQTRCCRARSGKPCWSSSLRRACRRSRSRPAGRWRQGRRAIHRLHGVGAGTTVVVAERDGVPIGTVDSTLTPGAAISTSALTCEKPACALLTSTAATDIHAGVAGGIRRRRSPALPAAAMMSTSFEATLL